MESKLVKLKSDFNNVITIRTSVKNIFDILQVKIDKLKLFYSEFIKNNKTEMFVFGLDSFHFQSKLIDIEYDEMKRLFLAINNRMYCEYFKLNKIIIDYTLINVNDKKITEVIKVNNFPVYKDLEPFKDYDFQFILEMHENILNLLSILISSLNNKENELSIHLTKKNIGLNIDNFITTFTYNIVVIREKINMFLTYIEFFHKLHTKYLKRFSNKIQLMYSHINNDIKFDDSIEINRNKRKELINEFSIEIIDEVLLKDIKKSMGSETTSSDSENGSPHNSLNELDVSVNGTPKSVDSDSTSVCSLKSVSNGNSTRIKSNSIESNNTKLSDIIKKNANQISGMFNLCKPKEEDVYNPLYGEEINDIFTEINNSCANIIDNNENIKMFINPMENDDKENEKNVIKALINPDSLMENVKEEIKQEVVIEEKEEKEEECLVSEEQNADDTVEYKSNYTSENENVEKKQSNKKRGYNRKKKIKPT